jgi:ribosomal protein S13
MSQRDLVAELRGARIAAPADVREHVRQIAAAATPSVRRLTWRRALVVALPVAAAVAAAVVVTRPGTDEHTATPLDQATIRSAAAPAQHGAALKSTGATGSGELAPAPAPGRAQRYGAYLSLRVPTPNGVSDGVKRALRIASSLGGYPTSVHAGSQGRSAIADLTLKVPRAHVQEALTKLAGIGTITSEQVDVQDVQAGLNATERTIERLQRQLAALRTAMQTDDVKRNIQSVTTRIEHLQRQEAAIVRATHYATVQLHLETKHAAAPVKHGHGPLHGLGVAFRWIGIGAVYALALGGPLVVLVALGWLLARTVRRRREEALLSRP